MKYMYCARIMLTATVVATMSVACAPSPGVVTTSPAGESSHETLNAVLWMQQSSEYKASALQAYRVASLRLDQAIADSSWDAIGHVADAAGTESPRRSGTAVILDVDETVLDNSPYQARLVETNSAYSRETWSTWVREERARPIPGAVEFTQTASEAGVTVFYVTNRAAELEGATRNNLVSQGFPVSDTEDVVLTRGERPEWSGDKYSRREFVSERYRVLLLVGDDLNDFVSADQISTLHRDKLVDRYADAWGEKWIVLPNPAYGSWERAVARQAGARSREAQLRVKSAALETR